MLVLVLVLLEQKVIQLNLGKYSVPKFEARIHSPLFSSGVTGLFPKLVIEWS